jgi:uncharacterized protein with HEPN domain
MKLDKPTSRERVQHVIEAIESIQSYSSGFTRDTFYADKKTLDACLYQFTIIGEATFQLEKELLKKYTYPWQKVKAFRNNILHEYFGIELRLIWDTIVNLLPELKALMQQILDNEFGGI